MLVDQDHDHGHDSEQTQDQVRKYDPLETCAGLSQVECSRLEHHLRQKWALSQHTSLTAMGINNDMSVFWFVDTTSFESESVNHVGGYDAHRDADVEGDGAEQVDVRVDVLVEVVSADWGNRGVADPEGVVREVEESDREENHPTDSIKFIPGQENAEI